MLNLSYNILTTLEQFPGKNLHVLDIQSNLLQGPILSTCLNPQIPNPPQFLKLFLISENKLTGNIPSLICNWSSLIVLDLSRNSLSGTIPECLGNFSDSLKFMNLQMNNFYGKIPDTFMYDNQLRNLFLNDNQLEGSLPRSLANCSSLEVINLGNNKLTDAFPHWLASLTRLQVLILQFNGLHGSMPNSIASCNFSALRIIDLSRNELTGPLPTKLFQNLRAMRDVPEETYTGSKFFWTGRDSFSYDEDPTYVNVTTKRSELKLVKTWAIFTAMDFSNNLFCGHIPEELGELISLQALNLSHNNFTGPIPPSYGNLVALESLDLSSNKLGGRIPSQLTNMTFLEVLDLSENDLVGPIPNGKQFDTFENDSYSGNLGLCSFPLSKQCDNQEGPKPPGPMFVTHEGTSAIPFIWKVAMMGYGCGVVLGLSIGYIVFTTRRPWWIVRKIERDWQKNVTKWIRRNGKRKN
ncbi:receptor like protein 30-like [Durio zibethinus]|uniref:Receptor like protein 30-like n=1 Tax=Durio zibethinus TaxID=66656 RepID=A0A6P6A7N8_DURZI|nr:receptor like protein 30-like [Durio zibethinus]